MEEEYTGQRTRLMPRGWMEDRTVSEYFFTVGLLQVVTGFVVAAHWWVLRINEDYPAFLKIGEGFMCIGGGVGLGLYSLLWPLLYQIRGAGIDTVLLFMVTAVALYLLVSSSLLARWIHQTGYISWKLLFLIVFFSMLNAAIVPVLIENGWVVIFNFEY